MLSRSANHWPASAISIRRLIYMTSNFGRVMDEATRQRLVELNQKFYRDFAESFSETRSEPQPGFFDLEKHLGSTAGSLLDVGCGEGRLGRFLLERGRIVAYDGIDGSEALLEFARRGHDGRFWHRDLAQANALRDISQYDNIACLAVLQHIPGRENRVGLMTAMGEHLRPNGRLIVSTWQFMTSERQRKKITDWPEAGLQPELLEVNDYLLTWNRGGRGLRYVSYIDELEMQALSREAGLRLLATFRADGREGDLNLYSVLEPLQHALPGTG